MRNIKVSRAEKRKIYKDIGRMLCRPKSLTSRILRAIGDECAAFGSTPMYPGRSIATIINIQRGKKYRSEYQKALTALSRLKENKLIEVETHGEQLVMALTKKGQSEYARSKARECPGLPPGTYCFVSFDIPEDVKRVRNILRKFLKQLDFELVHKSVWRSDRDVSALLAAMVKEADAEKWVTIIVGKEIR